MEETANSFVVMSWNMMNGGVNNNTGTDIRMRKDLILREVENMIKAKISVISLLEMGRFGELDNAVNELFKTYGYSVVVCRYNDSANPFSIFLAVNKYQVHIQDIVPIKLSEQHVVQTNKGERTIIARTNPMIRAVINGENVSIIIIHPDVHEQTRVDSFNNVIFPLIRNEQTRNQKIILMGDFNLFPDCETSKKILDGLQELLNTSNIGAGTWAGQPNDWPVSLNDSITKQLDYIFSNLSASKWFTTLPDHGKQLSGEMPNGEMDSVWSNEVYAMASDHIPVGMIYTSDHDTTDKITSQIGLYLDIYQQSII